MPYNMYMKHYTAKCLTALTLFFLFLAKGWGIDLKGKVIDRETGEPLVGATLSLPQIGRTTLSDNDGLFTFQLPAQRNYTLTAQPSSSIIHCTLFRIHHSLFINSSYLCRRLW